MQRVGFRVDLLAAIVGIRSAALRCAFGASTGFGETWHGMVAFAASLFNRMAFWRRAPAVATAATRRASRKAS